MKKTLQIEVEFESWFDKDREPKTNEEWVDFFAEHFISASSVIGDDEGLFQDMISIKGCNIEIIDPVVSALEKPYHTDEEISEAATNHYVWGQREPIGSRERATHETKKESFVAGATWMRDLIERRAK